MDNIVLTGIKPTGIVHIGNYFGAIKPALSAYDPSKYNTFYFIADYHALNMLKDPKMLKDYLYGIASAWLACGLDPEKSVFYRQSDIPQICELTTILSNITPKGLLNRAHAYKAMTDENAKKNLDADHGVNMGLFNYPLLMTADILLFNTKYVPVGNDQKQHLEIARDIAEYFNRTYGETFVLPEAIINEQTKKDVVGLDGRKMSKSYNNTIAINLNESQLKKIINKIVTDSSAPDEPKGTDNSIFSLYELVSTKEEQADFAKKLANGIGWGVAKSMLFEKMNETFAPIREKYNYYITHPHLVDEMLKKGKETAIAIAEKNLAIIKQRIGVL